MKTGPSNQDEVFAVHNPGIKTGKRSWTNGGGKGKERKEKKEEDDDGPRHLKLVRQMKRR